MEQSIHITIAERTYPLKIALSDEEKIRAAAKIINEKVDLYRKKYSNRDTQDALSMALLQFVIRLIESEQREEAGQIMEELKSIDQSLEQYLHNMGK
jgi:cell division protein ZapA